jgi:hypothetical protein
MDITFALIFAATIVIGLLSGASLDQSIKQLPARYRVGLTAYSQYSRASDLGNGILFYGILGVAAALLNIAAAIEAYLQEIPSQQSNLIYVGALLAVLHSLATTQAAPLNFSQRKISPSDEGALALVFNKFARWQNIRCVLQVLNFGVNLWALIMYLRAG